MSSRRVLLMWLVSGVVSLRAVAALEDRTFTRSLYLPVRFAICPNLDEGILYEGREPIAALPSRRIYQFTFYSDKGRILPESYTVEITAQDRLKSGIVRASLTISLEGVRIGDTFVYRSSRKDANRQLKRKRDAHLEEADLLIHCTEGDGCPRNCRPSGGGNGKSDFD